MMRKRRKINIRGDYNIYATMNMFQEKEEEETDRSSSLKTKDWLSWASHAVNCATLRRLVSFCSSKIAFKTYIGKIVVDSHDLGPIERPWRNEVNLVEPAILGGIRFHSASTLVSE